VSRGQALRRGLPATPGVAAPSDRRFRRADVAPDRRRRTHRALFRLLRWGVPAAVVLVAAAWASQRLLDTSLLRVRHVVISGTTRLSSGDVDALLDGIRQENVLHADLTAYRKRLLDSPWVADVTLSRVLPSTVEVRVIERVPMAVARLNAQLYLVDDTGVIIDEYGAGYQQYDLPVIDGLLTSPRAGGAVAPADRVRLAASLLSALNARADLRKRVSQIDVSNAHDAAVMFDVDPVWLHLGEDRFVARLQNYIDLRQTLQEKFHDMDYVDLRFDERVYVRASGRARTVPGAAAGRVR
jgi:cell division protein FtsQ